MQTTRISLLIPALCASISACRCRSGAKPAQPTEADQLTNQVRECCFIAALES